MWGGTGADTFVFAETMTFDEIHDFSVVEGDKLDVSALLTDYDPLTDTPADFIKFSDNGTHAFAQVDEDGGADNFDQIIKFVNTIVDDTDFTEGTNLLVA